MDNRVPVPYAYLHQKFKGSSAIDNSIAFKDVKRILLRDFFISKGSNGGNKKGIPRSYLNNVLYDLEYFGILRKVNKRKFYVNELTESNKSLRGFPF